MSSSPLWWMVASAGSVVTLIGTFFAWLRTKKRARSAFAETDLAITVMKPMSGLDPSLERNLASFAQLRGPAAFEVLLCLPSETDAAYPLAKAFAQRYPHRFRLVTGALPSLGNAKVAQLVNAWPRVRNDFVWVSESNVETSQEFMEELVKTWKDANQAKRVKTLVHAPLVGVGGSGLGAALERMHLASLQNANHELGLLVGLHAIVGKTEFFHRDDMEAMGGLEAFGNYLGEDYMMGAAFANAGTVRCISVPTRNVLGHLSVAGWYERHARWAVMRKTLVGGAFYGLEPQVYLAWPTFFFALGLIPSWLMATLVATRVVVDGVNYAMQARTWPTWTDLLAVPLKELVLFVAWVQAVFTLRVKWRAGRWLELGPNSLVLTRSPEPQSRSAQADPDAVKSN